MVTLSMLRGLDRGGRPDSYDRAVRELAEAEQLAPCACMRRGRARILEGSPDFLGFPSWLSLEDIDPDCELHLPWRVGTTRARVSAVRWWMAGYRTGFSTAQLQAADGFLEADEADERPACPVCGSVEADCEPGCAAVPARVSAGRLPGYVSELREAAGAGYVRAEALEALDDEGLAGLIAEGGPAELIRAARALLASRTGGPVCGSCGKVMEAHPSGLCDSCETQARYDEQAARSARFPLGARVVLARDVDRYPHFVAEKGSAGVVTVCDETPTGVLLAVRLDDPPAGSETWDGEVQWWDGMDPSEDLMLEPASAFEVPEDRAGTVFDAGSETFAPIMAAIQAGEFERAAGLLSGLAAGLAVQVSVAEDGAVVVQIDTPPDSQVHESIRVHLNDSTAAGWVA